LSAAFLLTGFFLHRHVDEPRGSEAATARDGFVQAALNALNPALRTLSGPNGISA
ncbi:DNA repair protein RecO, partial [Rhizobium ruizarguesonis]